jgi:hypothetical protein
VDTLVVAETPALLVVRDAHGMHSGERRFIRLKVLAVP